MNVRLFSCDNASSFAAAGTFVGRLPERVAGPYGLVMEGIEAVTVLRDLRTTLDAGMLLEPVGRGDRLFVQGTLQSFRRIARRLPSLVADHVDAALDVFFSDASAPPTTVMGILNVTPDSFSDGGQWLNVDAAVERALEMIEQGAEIIDIGGESTRPGAAEIPEMDELRRVLPVIERLRPLTRARLSVDTRKFAVAWRCLEVGADMVNDVSGLTYGTSVAGAVAKFPQAQLILMHQRRKPSDETYSTEYDAAGKPVYEDVVADTMRWLRTQVTSAVRSGVRPEQLWIDPGFGFGKTYEQNIELLRRIREYTSMGLPILLGTSRKSSVGRLQGGGEPDDRLEGSLATACWAVSQGVRAVRVHDVRETVRAVRAADALRPRVL